MDNLKQFKIRIEDPCENWHSIEVYLQADNILNAGADVMHRLTVLGIDNGNVTKIIELEPKPFIGKCVLGYVGCTYNRTNENSTAHINHHRR